MNPFLQLVCKEVWAEYKLGQVLQLDSSLHLQAKNKKKSYHILLQLISQTLIPAVWWGKDISNSMETHWCHRLSAYACTHTHASSQIDRKSACTRTQSPISIGQCKKHKCLLHFSSAQQLFSCLFSLCIYVFFPHSHFWHLLQTATGKNGHRSSRVRLGQWRCSSAQHESERSSCRVWPGSGLCWPIWV